MERIGIAASKMSKGNVLLYNLFVILISFLFSLLIFSIVGCAISIALIIISFLLSDIMPVQFGQSWTEILAFCMMALTVLMGLFTLFAIVKNIRFRSKEL